MSESNILRPLVDSANDLEHLGRLPQSNSELADLPSVSEIEVKRREKFETYRREAMEILKAMQNLRYPDDFLEYKYTSQDELEKIVYSDINFSALEAIVMGLREEVTKYQEFDGKKKKEVFEARDRLAKLLSEILPKLENALGEVTQEKLESTRVSSLEFNKEARETLRLVGEDTQNDYFKNKSGYEKLREAESDLPEFDDFFKLYKILYMAQSLDTNAPVLINSIGSFESVSYEYINVFDTSILDLISVPIGEYGRDLSDRMQQAVERIAVALKSIEPVYKSYEGSVGEDEVRDFYRGFNPEPGSSDSPLMLTTYEGAITLQQAFSLLTAQIIEGYDYQGDDKLLSDLLESGIVDQLARLIPYAGYIGPMNLRGIYFKDLVKFEQEKGFVINRELVKLFHEDRLGVRLNSVYSQPSDTDKFSSLHGCPAAMRNPDGSTSVGELGKLFLEAFKATTKHRI